jgi:ABC-type phosphate transport system substrate-binding protein
MRYWIVFLTTLICGAAAAGQEPNGRKPVSGVLVIVNERGNPKLKKISFSTLRKIYNCEIKSWKDVPGSDRTDPILAYASDESSEVSLFFMRRVGKVQLANCVTVISGQQSDKIIASGLAALPANSNVKEVVQGVGIISADLPEIPKGVRVLSVSDNNKKPAGPYITPSPEAIRTQTYPLSQKSIEHTDRGSEQKAGRPLEAMVEHPPATTGK